MGNIIDDMVQEYLEHHRGPSNADTSLNSAEGLLVLLGVAYGLVVNNNILRKH